MRAHKSREAFATCEQARSLFHAIGNVPGEAGTELLSGQFYASRGQNAQAMRHYTRALALYQKVQDTDGEAKTLSHIGAIEESQGRLTLAGQYYQRALSLLENTRASLGGLTDSKTSFLEEQFPLYQRYIRLLLQTGQKGQAFAWTQKAKARVLIDLMETGRVLPGAVMTERDRQEEACLKRRDRALSQKWLDVMTGQPDKNKDKQPNRPLPLDGEFKPKPFMDVISKFTKDA
jgi:tetratricopeptide (TPR) repeat protein